MNENSTNPPRAPLSRIELNGDTRIVEFRGADVDAFLQGQLTADVRKLLPGAALRAGFCSPKGRLLATLALSRTSDGAIYAALPDAIAARIVARLKMFVLRSKVSIALLDTTVIGLLGNLIGPRLAELGFASGAADAGTDPSATVHALPCGVRRCLLFGPSERIATLLAQDPGIVDGALGDWHREEIRAGWPRIVEATQDHYVPQMVNLDQLGALSFDKGCYTGQEIVARLHYIGDVKRRMFMCEGEGPPPAPGSPVHAEQGGQAVGSIVQAVPAAAGSPLYLAAVVLQLSQASGTALYCEGRPLGPPRAYEYDG